MNPRINALLAGLPESEYRLLISHMELVSLPKGRDLFTTGQVPSHVYYPVGALISMMKDMPDGFSVETYMIGKAGLSGIVALDGPSHYRANVRDAGLAYRIPLPVLKSLLLHCPVHERAITSTMRRMLIQLTQAVVCGKHHSVEQQLIRWMLISVDRTLEPVIHLTHQEVSERLGFRREAITLRWASSRRWAMSSRAGVKYKSPNARVWRPWSAIATGLARASPNRMPAHSNWPAQVWGEEPAGAGAQASGSPVA